MSDTFIEKYVNDIKETLLAIDNSIDEKELEKFIYEKYINNNKLLKNREIYLVNNYLKTKTKHKLKSIINFYYNKKPIFTAFGSFFYPHNEKRNLNADFINFLMSTRKYHKNLQFEGQNENDKKKESFHKKQQLTWKLLNNSYYGTTGQASSQFYNMIISQSITYMGYAIITTSIIGFERFLANNYKYPNFNNLLIFLKDSIKEAKGILKYLDKENIKSLTNVKNYIAKNLINFELNDEQNKILNNFLNNCSKEEINVIYYKNNLYKFLKNSYFINLLKQVLSTDIINPKKASDESKEIIKNIWEICKKYVYNERQVFGREEYVPQMERKVILGCDTDSNFLSIDSWYKWVNKYIDYEKNENSEYTTANVIVMLISYFIQDVFNCLTRNCNVPKDKQELINMKSELLFPIVIYTRNKKQYISLISLKEGNIVTPPEVNITGISIKKATVANKTRQFFNGLIKKEFLVNDIDVSRILRKLNKFENYIKDSLNSGNIEFTKPMKLNDVDSYKFPMQQPVVRGTLIWNEIYPNNSIETPNKVNLLKLKCESLSDLKPIYDTEYFNIIKDMVYTSKKNAKDEETNLFLNYGFDVICLPKNLNKIPEWIIPFIDIDSIIDDNVRNVNILLNSLGLELMEYRGKEYYSNFISF